MTSLSFHKNPTEDNIDITLKEVFDDSYSDIPLRLHHTSYGEHVKQVIRHHWHKEMEILYIADGTMTVTIENATFIAEQGDIVIIPPSFLHSATNELGTDVDFYAVVFDLNFLSSSEFDSIQKKYISPFFNTPENFTFYVKHNQELYGILTEIIEKYATKSIGYEIFIKYQLLRFIYELTSNLDVDFCYVRPNRKRKSNTSLSCRQIVSYIENNYASRITIAEIAEFSGFTKQYFCKFFKKYFGISFVTYLNQYRINRAEYLLTFTEKKILDICMETGFDNISYFSNLFKRLTGLSPAKYREQLRP